MNLTSQVGRNRRKSARGTQPRKPVRARAGARRATTPGDNGNKEVDWAKVSDLERPGLYEERRQAVLEVLGLLRPDIEERMLQLRGCLELMAGFAENDPVKMDVGQLLQLLDLHGERKERLLSLLGEAARTDGGSASREDARPTDAAAPAAEATAAQSECIVPLRSFRSFRGEMERERLQARPSEKPQLSAQVTLDLFGFNRDAAFRRGELLGFVCNVITEHRQYLMQVVAPALATEGQSALLEGIAYAQEFVCLEIKHGSVEKIPDPIILRSLPGLAGGRAFMHEELFVWLCELVFDVHEVILAHFVRGDARRISAQDNWNQSGGMTVESSVVEWGEVLEIAKAEMERDSIVEFDTGAGYRLRAKARELMCNLGSGDGRGCSLTWAMRSRPAAPTGNELQP
jgi:hypothetical protein